MLWYIAMEGPLWNTYSIHTIHGIYTTIRGFNNKYDYMDEI